MFYQSSFTPIQKRIKAYASPYIVKMQAKALGFRAMV